MKYLEELSIGDTFFFDEDLFILTPDFKASGHKNCINLNTGFARWLSDQTVVYLSPIYRLDADNAVVPIKIYKNAKN